MSDIYEGMIYSSFWIGATITVAASLYYKYQKNKSTYELKSQAEQKYLEAYAKVSEQRKDLVAKLIEDKKGLDDIDLYINGFLPYPEREDLD